MTFKVIDRGPEFDGDEDSDEGVLLSPEEMMNQGLVINGFGEVMKYDAQEKTLTGGSSYRRRYRVILKIKQ